MAEYHKMSATERKLVMSKLTAGPWTVGEEVGDISIVAPDDSHVAIVLDWDEESELETGDVCKANARLIAAAPDLLEALKAMVAEREYETEHKIRINAPTNGERDARAAIAKATGQ